MRGKRKSVVVTGGLGFIGARFIRYVYENTDWKIINIDKETYASNHERLREDIRSDSARYYFLKMDICDEISKHKVIFDAQYVVNFAAESHVDNSIEDGSPFVETNVLGTFNLLEVFKKSPALKKFVQISTDEVYGDMNDLRGIQDATESFNLRPSSYYSASKASADLLVQSCARTFGIPYLITRSCNNFGPGQDPEKFLPTVFKCVRDGSLIPLYGDGKQVREWIHTDDNVAIIFDLMLSKSENEVYNIGSGIHYQNVEIIKTLAKYMKKGVRFESVPDRLGHDRVYRLDCSKLDEFYGDWVPQCLEGFLKDEITRQKDTSNRG